MEASCTKPPAGTGLAFRALYPSARCRVAVGKTVGLG